MKRSRLAALALFVGVVYSLPYWWWLFTLPNYSIVRGHILSDDDVIPYAAAINVSARGLPLTGPFLGVYENYGEINVTAVSYWLTDLLLGGLARLTGSLEGMLAVAFLLSGAATFLLTYALALRLLMRPAAAVAVALLVNFGYPFYTSLVAFLRRLAETGGRTDAIDLLSRIYPGMVNGNMLYPHLRWPVPGLMFWWFLAALILLHRLWRSDAEAPGPASASAQTPAPAFGGRKARAQTAAAAAFVGLSSYIYGYFATYLVALAAGLCLAAWLTARPRAARRLAVVVLIALAATAPLLVLTAQAQAPEAARQSNGGQPIFHVLADFGPDLHEWLKAVSVHGMLALAAALSTWPGGPAPGATVRRRLAAWWQSLRQPGQSDALWLFALHAVVIALYSLEWTGVRLEGWHWSEYIMNVFTPLTAGWLVARRLAGGGQSSTERPKLGMGWLIWPALCLLAGVAGWLWSQGALEAALATGLALGFLALAPRLANELPPRAALAAIVLVTPFAWYYYHRTSNNLSWLAFLPLAVLLAARRPAWLRPAVWGLVGLNAALALSLQAWVRPALARDFFTLPAATVQALEWLDDNTPAVSVVATNGWMSEYLIRAYTHNLTTDGQDWWSSLAPGHGRTRQAIRSAIYQVPPDAQARQLENRDAAAADFKAKVNQRWVGGPDMDILYEKQTGRRLEMDAYEAAYQMPLAEVLRQVRVDYVWVGPWERLIGRADLAHAPELTLLFDNSEIQIYQVAAPP